MEGVYSGFDSKLYQQQREVREKVDPENTLPIGTKDALLNEKYHETYTPTTWKSGGGSSKGGWSEGSARGKNIKIRQGIRKSNASRRLALTG